MGDPCIQIGFIVIRQVTLIATQVDINCLSGKERKQVLFEGYITQMDQGPDYWLVIFPPPVISSDKPEEIRLGADYEEAKSIAQTEFPQAIRRIISKSLPGQKPV